MVIVTIGNKSQNTILARRTRLYGIAKSELTSV
jgi:hypothetical protein